MVGVLVAFVIWSELRAAGLFGGVRRESRGSPAAEWRRRILLADVAKAPLAEQPGMLLRLLGEALTRTQRLPAADGLTATAIARRARLESDDEREELRRVGETADAVRYASGRRPTRPSRARWARRGRCSKNSCGRANADARTRRRIPAGSSRLSRRFMVCGCDRRPRSIRRPTSRGRPPPSVVAMVMPVFTNGCSDPAWTCGRCAIVTARCPISAFRRAAICWSFHCPRWKCSTATNSARSIAGCARGNTLLITAALLDQPDWAARRSAGAVVEIESLTAIEFETRRAREARLDDTPLAQRVREADAREARNKNGKDDEAADDAVEDDEGEEDTEEGDADRGDLLDVPEKLALTATGPHVLLEGVKTLELVTDYEAQEWSLRMPYDNFVLTLARTASGEGALFEQRVGEGRVLLSAGGSALHQPRARQCRQCAAVRQHREAHVARWRGVVRRPAAGSCRPATIPRASTTIRACSKRSSSCSGCGSSGCSDLHDFAHPSSRCTIPPRRSWYNVPVV
jgi:hypothetical protein